MTYPPSTTRPDSAVKDGSQAERIYDYLRSRPSDNAGMTRRLRRRSLRHPLKTR